MLAAASSRDCAILRRLEDHEHDAGVRSVDEPIHRQAGKRNRIGDARMIEGELGHAANDSVGAIERCRVGQLRECHEVVLVLRRHEALRHTRESECRQADEPGIEDEDRKGHAEDPRHAARVSRRRAFEEAVEEAEEPAKDAIDGALHDVARRPVAAQQA